MAVIYANRRSKEKTADEDDKTRTVNDQYIVKTDNDTDDQANHCRAQRRFAVRVCSDGRVPARQR